MRGRKWYIQVRMCFTTSLTHYCASEFPLPGAACLMSAPESFESQATCATSGEGLFEGLDWLSSNITGDPA